MIGDLFILFGPQKGANSKCRTECIRDLDCTLIKEAMLLFSDHFLPLFRYVAFFEAAVAVSEIVFSLKSNRQIKFTSGIWTSLTWLRWFGFRLRTIFASATAASRNTACFKSGQKCLKNNHLAPFSLSP